MKGGGEELQEGSDDAGGEKENKMGGDREERSNNSTQTCNSWSIFWDSSEAAKLFGCVYGIDDVFKVLSERVTLLPYSIQTAYGCCLYY